MTKLSPRAAAAVSLIGGIALISAIGGALYSVVSFPDTPFFSALRGSITGATISLLITAFEYGLSSGRLQPLRQLPVGLLLAFRTVAYTFLIIVGYEFGRLVARTPGESIFEFDHFFWQTVWLSVGVSFVLNTTLEVSRLLGGEVVWGLLIGRYMVSHIEERVVLFLDLKESTQHAERLGDLKFHRLLNNFFEDVSHAVLYTGGSIYKYNGDAAIVLWRPKRGLRNAACVRCVVELRRRLENRAGIYRESFDLAPGFRAGLHMGPVVVGEIGDQRREIAYSGDAMNTTARIEQATRDLGVDFLVSATVVDRLPPLRGLSLRFVGSVAIPGKAEKLSLSTVDRI